MNVKMSVFVICVKAIICLLLYNLHDCTFKEFYNFLSWENGGDFLNIQGCLHPAGRVRKAKTS